MNKNTKVILISDIHYCCADYFGRPQEEAARMLCNDLAAEYEKEPYNVLLLLGDYSLDHWAWQKKGTYISQGVSNTKLFAERYLDKLAPKGVNVRMIAGNHEQYGEELWHELTGHQRRDHIVIGDVLFILIDTFGANLDPTEHSDGTYCGANVADIKELMAKYPDKKVILCAHWFDINAESEEFCTLLRNEKRIICLFCGHKHKSHIVSTGAENGNKPIIYTGHYSYSGESDSIRCLPGYRVLEIDRDGIASKYVVHPHTYKIGNVRFSNEYAEHDIFELKF